MGKKRTRPSPGVPCQLRFIFRFVSFKPSSWAIFILESFNILNLEMHFMLVHREKHRSFILPKTKAKLVSFWRFPGKEAAGVPVPPLTHWNPITYDLISTSCSLCITILLTTISTNSREKEDGSVVFSVCEDSDCQSETSCGLLTRKVTKSHTLWTKSPLCDWILRSRQAMHVRYFYTLTTILLWTWKCCPNRMFSRWVEDRQLAIS